MFKLRSGSKNPFLLVIVNSWVFARSLTNTGNNVFFFWVRYNCFCFGFDLSFRSVLMANTPRITTEDFLFSSLHLLLQFEKTSLSFPESFNAISQDSSSQYSSSSFVGLNDSPWLKVRRSKHTYVNKIFFQVYFTPVSVISFWGFFSLGSTFRGFDDLLKLTLSLATFNFDGSSHRSGGETYPKVAFIKVRSS